MVRMIGQLTVQPLTHNLAAARQISASSRASLVTSASSLPASIEVSVGGRFVSPENISKDSDSFQVISSMSTTLVCQ